VDGTRFAGRASLDLSRFALSGSDRSAFALAGVGAFRGAALGDGWDPGAVGRFFAIYLSGTAACGQNLEFSMPSFYGRAHCRRPTTPTQEFESI
jgi:hypothetical protein